MTTKTNHKYRVNVYLGKELYEELNTSAKIMGVSLPTLCKIVLNTGYELSKSLESRLKGGKNNGEIKQS